MKCPKCGYNSFEYLEQCKKCSNDLVLFKESTGIRSVLVPVEKTAAAPAVEKTPEMAADTQQEASGGGEFIWDAPAQVGNTATEGGAEALPDFSFAGSEATTASDENLGDLLESTVHVERRPAAVGTDQSKAQAAGVVTGFDSAPGEFDMGDFLAQEKEQSETKAAQPQEKPVDGDFDFLFSSNEENK